MDKPLKHIPLIMTAILMTVMLACCRDENRFSSYQHISLDDGWSYGDTLTFIPIHADSIAKGDCRVIVRHSNDYPYANLWLEVSYTAADGSEKRDTVNMILADTYGHWQGQRLGLHYQHRVKALENVEHVIGTPLRIRHIMRVDTVREIDLVGIEFN